MRLLRGGQRLAPAALTALVNRETRWWWTCARRPISRKATSPAREAAGAGRGEAGTQAAGRGEIAAGGAGVQGRPERHGRRGVLRKAGFERVFVLDGGIDGWQQAGLPLAIKGR